MMDREQITAVVLAGGRGRRMDGRDKGLVELAGKPLIEHIIAGLAPQVGGILINANRNRERYLGYGYPVIGDSLEDYQGPLAGFAAAMQAIETPYMVTLPCDAPQVVDTLVERLCEALQSEQAEIAVPGQLLNPRLTYLHLWAGHRGNCSGQEQWDRITGKLRRQLPQHGH